jgi:hypothetical protein
VAQPEKQALASAIGANYSSFLVCLKTPRGVLDQAIATGLKAYALKLKG